jgi:dTDP-4-dehydrorhamnose 3,5-epimerase-like enzyme
VDQDGTQVLKMATCDDDQGSNSEKKEEKNKNGLKAKVTIGPFLFRQSRRNRVRGWIYNRKSCYEEEKTMVKAVIKCH